MCISKFMSRGQYNLYVQAQHSARNEKYKNANLKY